MPERLTAALQPYEADAVRAIGRALQRTLTSADVRVAEPLVVLRVQEATARAVDILNAAWPLRADQTQELVRRRSGVRQLASPLAADMVVALVEQGVLRRDQMAVELQFVIAREIHRYLVALLAEWDTQRRPQ